jgi:recombination protein RecA
VRKKVTRARRADPGAEFASAISDDFLKVLLYSDDRCLAHLGGFLSTGCLDLDRVLGGRGIPLGRIIEIFGQWHVGKTTLLDCVFASAQRGGGWGVVADTETAKSVEYSQRIGVDPSRLSYLQFERGKGTLENVLRAMIKSIRWWRTNYPETPVVIGLDSLGGTPTDDEMRAPLAVEEDDGEGKTKKGARQPGAAARVMQGFKRIVPQELGGTKISVVIVNHEYQSWSSGRTRRETYGGEAMRSAASLRLKLYSAGNWLQDSRGNPLGREIECEVIKDKVYGSTGQRCSFALLHGVGIDNTWGLLEGLTRAGLASKGGGGHYAINLDGEILKFQGWAGFRQLCLAPATADKPSIFDRLVGAYQAQTRVV